MPAQNKTGGNNRPSSAPEQIASSNATAHQFLNTRQPSWMSKATTKPTSRPTAPTRKTVVPAVQHQQQILAQTVLPSPAPSDEPSPAVSNTLDSPNPQPATLSEAQPLGSFIAAPLPVTEARFVHDLAVDTSGSNMQGLSTSQGNNGSLSAPIINPTNSPLVTQQYQLAVDAGGEARLVTLTPAVQSAPSNFPGNMGPQGQVSTVGGTRPTGGAPPPPKRRRTDNQPSFKYASCIGTIDQHIQNCGGDSAFTADIERPRMQLLKDACIKEDVFFLALHQLYAIWSEYPADAHKLIPAHPPTTIDSAFGIIETVLKKNQHVSPMHRSFFANFPAPIQQLMQPLTNYEAVIERVGKFLEKLSTSFHYLRHMSLTRKYPFLVDELLHYLACSSPVLQMIFFTASRRILGVPDGPMGHTIEQLFREDQKNHRNEKSGLLVLAPLTYQGEIESRNSKLIGMYKRIIAMSLPPAQQPQIPSNGPSPAQSPAPGAGQSPIPPHMVLASQDAIAGQGSGTANQALHSPFTPGSQFPTVFAPPATQGQPRPHASPLMMAPTPYTPAQATPMQFATMSNNQISQQYAPSMSAGNVAQNTMAPNRPQIHPQYQALAPQYQAPQQPQQMYQQHQSHQQPVQPQQQFLDQQTVRQIVQQQQHQHILQQQRQQHQQQLHEQQQRRSSSSRTGNVPIQPGRLVAPQIQHPAVASPVQMSPAAVTFPSQSIPTTPTGSTGYRSLYPASNGLVPVAQLAAQASIQENALQRHKAMQAKDPLLPRKGYVIPRPEIPHDPSDRKSVMMSLHQAHVRSPKRMASSREPERFYQALKSIVAGPSLMLPKNLMQKITFKVTRDQFALRSTSSNNSTELLPVAEHSNGSLRWRIRCCRIPVPEKAVTEQQWSTLDVSWPPNIFMTVNKQVLSVRRHTHNGKDLPTELTNFIVCGTNVIEIAIPDMKRDNTNNRFLAVEILETLSHSSVVELVWKNGPIPEGDTLQTIKGRLVGPPDEDGISFESPDLPIDLADPFSSVIFKIPARGVSCTHMECFDLENWLNTRPCNPPSKCPHGMATCSCPPSSEPTNPDKWRCPICFKDARPYSLRIDSFLLKVRKQLEQQNKLHTKSMRVRADGQWTVVVEEADVADSDDDDDVPLSLLAKKPPAPAASIRRPEVEVIELDDD
ncbi:hypothetical protein B0H63DRAFT_222308 [Podospora didyma]|uniref:SP-RING-type domain-containing protein n=1 Tax=Podospora didyma TaxID=330526 RepID=A0AAE0KKF6_9PEZI|nr:hypothetical protein B0H63DRAFT_222308 [Podospora didyma]